MSTDTASAFHPLDGGVGGVSPLHPLLTLLLETASPFLVEISLALFFLLGFFLLRIELFHRFFVTPPPSKIEKSIAFLEETSPLPSRRGSVTECEKPIKTIDQEKRIKEKIDEETDTASRTQEKEFDPDTTHTTHTHTDVSEMKLQLPSPPLPSTHITPVSPLLEKNIDAKIDVETPKTDTKTAIPSIPIVETDITHITARAHVSIKNGRRTPTDAKIDGKITPPAETASPVPRKPSPIEPAVSLETAEKKSIEETRIDVKQETIVHACADIQTPVTHTHTTPLPITTLPPTHSPKETPPPPPIGDAIPSPPTPPPTHTHTHPETSNERKKIEKKVDGKSKKMLAALLESTGVSRPLPVGKMKNIDTHTHTYTPPPPPPPTQETEIEMRFRSLVKKIDGVMGTHAHTHTHTPAQLAVVMEVWEELRTISEHTLPLDHLRFVTSCLVDIHLSSINGNATHAHARAGDPLTVVEYARTHSCLLTSSTRTLTPPPPSPPTDTGSETDDSPVSPETALASILLETCARAVSRHVSLGVLDVCARACALIEDVYRACACAYFEKETRPIGDGIFAHVLSVFALARDFTRLEAFWAERTHAHARITTHTYTPIVRALLHLSPTHTGDRNADARACTRALDFLIDARARDISVPAFLLSMLFRSVGELCLRGGVTGDGVSGDGVSIEKFIERIEKYNAHEGGVCVCDEEGGVKINNNRELTLPVECVCVVLECAQRTHNHTLAKKMDAYTHEYNLTLPYAGYECLLKVCAQAGDVRALEVFDEMCAKGFHLSESTLVSVVSACAETKFVRLAEHVTQFIRSGDATRVSGVTPSRDVSFSKESALPVTTKHVSLNTPTPTTHTHTRMTLPVYSALMKVYAHAHMYARACDLYTHILSDGLTPDTTMYGCLMKFAVECGRTELARELFSNCKPDVQSYMSMIRACGKERNAARALELAKKIEEETRVSGGLDTTFWNCVLDVLVTCGDVCACVSLFGDMRRRGNIDVVTYNTILKCMCNAEDLEGAEKLLDEMSERHRETASPETRGDGVSFSKSFAPNDVTFNSIINAAVSAQKFDLAWRMVEKMTDTFGIKPDAYTCSIMMKALKQTTHTQTHNTHTQQAFRTHVEKTLRLVESTNICADEILFACYLDVCVRTKDSARLDFALRQFRQSAMKPNVHTYGTLIKALGQAGRVGECRSVWREMLNDRHIEPNEVAFGCMIDALVSNGCVEDAMQLFGDMRAQSVCVRANTVMYTTLIKGFAQQKQVDRALQLYHQMKIDNITLNGVTFNSLIDACARVGSMDTAAELLEDMAQAGLTPDLITYSTIIKGFCVQGDIEQALLIFKAMRARGLHPDAILFNSLLDGLARKQMVDACEDLLADMRAHAIPPSNYTLTILIKLYGRSKNIDKAFEICAQYPVQYGFELNGHVYTCLMSACIGNRMHARAVSVFEDMKRAGLVPDSKTYDTIIGGALRAQDYARACALVEEMYETQLSVSRDRKGDMAKRNGNGRRHGDTDKYPIDPKTIESVVNQVSRAGCADLFFSMMSRLQSLNAPVDPRLVSMCLRGGGVGGGMGVCPPQHMGGGYNQRPQQGNWHTHAHTHTVWGYAPSPSPPAHGCTGRVHTHTHTDACVYRPVNRCVG